MYRYAAQNVDPETTSKAVGRDLPVKPKFGINVCRAIKGMPLARAKTYLENVTLLKQAVPFKTHKTNVKHRKGGIGPGQFPVKVAAATLEVLKQAEANAEYKGLDPEKMIVWHAVAHKAAPIPGFMPRAQGRATQWNTQCSHIEIVLREAEESEEAETKTTKKEE
ncbi:MAG TPA: 50S ribosomal protein L22 [Candidatus Thermoplasmatota archaeon]|nr:50S ribosomal protein L22 [Candidatus Thermoplasmatota archaeon]